jgi:hypothetical protein
MSLANHDERSAKTKMKRDLFKMKMEVNFRK